VAVLFAPILILMARTKTQVRLDKRNNTRSNMHNIPYSDKTNTIGAGCLIGQTVVNKWQKPSDSRAVNSSIMSQHCDIQLERPTGVYYSGETVNGHIYLTLPERALIKGKRQ